MNDYVVGNDRFSRLADEVYENRVTPLPRGKVRFAKGALGLLRKVVKNQQVLMLAARTSNVGGRKGNQTVAGDAVELVEFHAEQSGQDLSEVIPTEEEMASLISLHGITINSVDSEGLTFRNRFVLLDFSQFGFVLLLCCGSAAKETADYEQPNSDLVAALLDLLGPRCAGLVAKRIDRLFRLKEGVDGVWEALVRIQDATGEIYVADDNLGRWPVGDEEFLDKLRDEAHRAGLHAKEFVRKRERSVHRLTGKRMVDGKVPVGLPLAPPGFMRYRVRDTRRVMMAVDTPRNYPDSNHADGLPNVYRPNCFIRVDQADLTRSILAFLGTDGLHLSHWDQWLIQEQYSTESLRSRFGSSASFGSHEHTSTSDTRALARTIEQTIKANFSVYTHGRLEFVANGKKRAINELWHPDGEPWLSEESRLRIEEMWAREAAYRTPARKGSWSGMPVTLDGQPAEIVMGNSKSSWRDVEWFVRPTALPNSIDGNPETNQEDVA